MFPLYAYCFHAKCSHFTSQLEVCRSYLRYLVVHTQHTKHIPFYLNTLLHFNQRISPGPRHKFLFRNEDSFYGEELLVRRPNPKLEDHPLSAVLDCLIGIVAATLHIWRPFLHPQPPGAPYLGGKHLKFENGKGKRHK